MLKHFLRILAENHSRNLTIRVAVSLEKGSGMENRTGENENTGKSSSSSSLHELRAPKVQLHSKTCDHEADTLQKRNIDNVLEHIDSAIVLIQAAR